MRLLQGLERRFATVENQRIAYHRGGEGSPLLLVHGITTYSFIWRRLLPALAEDHDVIAVDLLGCGASDKPRGVDYSIRAQAELLLSLVDQLALDGVHLVAHDIGGGVGQIVATRRPTWLRDLVLINSVAHDFWPVQPISTMRVPFIRQLAMSVMDLGVLKMIIQRGMFHKERLDEELMELFLRPLRSREGRQGFLQLARCLENRQLIEIAPQLRTLDLPVLVIRGEADPYLGPQIAERLQREIPGARLERIETGGHFLQEDEPELLLDLIRDFTRQRDAGSS